MVDTLWLVPLVCISSASQAAAGDQALVRAFHRRMGTRSVSLDVFSPPSGPGPARAKPRNLRNESAQKDAGNGIGEPSDWMKLFAKPGHVHGLFGKLTYTKHVDAEGDDPQVPTVDGGHSKASSETSATVESDGYEQGYEQGYEKVQLPLVMIPIMLLIISGCYVHTTCGRLEDSEQRRHHHRNRWQADWQEKVDTLFAMCDRDRDGVLTYEDIQWMVGVTASPNKRNFTRERFGDLCRPVGANPSIGLDRQKFRDCLALLDTDVEHDCESVAKHLNTEDRGVVRAQAGGLMLDEGLDAA